MTGIVTDIICDKILELTGNKKAVFRDNIPRKKRDVVENWFARNKKRGSKEV